MPSKITLALADDELLFRQGLISIISKEKKLDILFDAEDGNDLIKQLRTAAVKPEIILTDLKMPGLNGVEVTKLVRQEFPCIKIIALTSYYSKQFILNMISIGAVAYLAKNSTPKLMIKTINEVAENGFYYDDQVMNYIHDDLLNTNKENRKSNFDKAFLTKREREVMTLICKQYTTNEIGEKLFISPRTVEGHRNNLLSKTASKNIAGLVVYCIQNKLVDLEEQFE
ncbi:response regulator transcription factor [Winogradskyella sp. UBA3174]|uniref:response regulator transcription factor n=1 Tax=Winogradskyella sp. UBA3174 TaxID=1947785 RepID=UPI0025D5B294|nr:response regulator transcription factor [Winogradskyella sp. UBA3174]|tara:strand:+ start:11673 stop:12353 length:681 start_codon:yes stop_codon:yes gene_type:complete